MFSKMSKIIDHDSPAALEGEKLPLESESAKYKPAHSRAHSEYDTLPILEAGPVIAGLTAEHGAEAVLESQAGETGFPPRMSTGRMVVLAAGMMMTYFVGVGRCLRSRLT